MSVQIIESTIQQEKRPKKIHFQMEYHSQNTVKFTVNNNSNVSDVEHEIYGFQSEKSLILL